MKKKFRDITVDGVKYAWKATYGHLTVYKDKNTEIFNSDIRESTITPKIISKIIKDFCNI
jgi:hypothetical protein